MESKAIKSAVEINGSAMNYTISDKASGEKHVLAVALNAIFPGFDNLPEIAQRALAFATRTKLRNGTGGKTLAEAKAAIESTLKQLSEGKWVSATRQGSGETRISLFIRALAQAMGADTDAALETYNSKVEETAKANGIDPEADDEETVKALAKVTAAVKKAFMGLPQVEAAFRQIKLAEDQKKAEAAAAKAAEAGGAISLGSITLASEQPAAQNPAQ